LQRDVTWQTDAIDLPPLSLSFTEAVTTGTVRGLSDTPHIDYTKVCNWSRPCFTKPSFGGGTVILISHWYDHW
jgi:hypothetical protein